MTLDEAKAQLRDAIDGYPSWNHRAAEAARLLLAHVERLEQDDRKRERRCWEYRVISVRADGGQKTTKHRSMVAVRERVGRLTHPEPWRFYASEDDRRRDGDELMCCEGGPYQECGCGGDTVRQNALATRENLPPVVSVRVERRQVTTTSWQPSELPDLAAYVESLKAEEPPDA